MRVIRYRLSCLIVAWLAFQTAGLIAAPVLARLGLDEDACCQGLAPGQTCPMHHHSREGDRTCKMRSACPRGETALVSLVGGVGLLPPPTDVVTPFEVGDPLRPLAPSPLARADRPDAPPPRS